MNGALQELGETMADNLQTMGVSDALASDGLTTLAGKILDIQTGGSCYHIEFSEASYTAIGGSATLEIYLQENYAPKSGATVTVTGSDSSVYTATTNSSGVASVTVTGISASTVFTATYQGATATCTVTVQTYIFYDDASVDHSSTLFGNHISLRNSGTATVGYNANGYYTITNTRNGAEAFIEFKPLYGITSSFKVTIRSKGTTTARCPICLYYYKDNNNWGGLKTETDYTYYSDKTNGTYSEHQTTGTTGLNKNDECIVEFIYDSSLNKMTMNVYDTSMVLKKSINMNVPITLPSSVKWGTTTTWDRNTRRNLYEIKAEYL